jgi:hypothetical protein
MVRRCGRGQGGGQGGAEQHWLLVLVLVLVPVGAEAMVERSAETPDTRQMTETETAEPDNNY